MSLVDLAARIVLTRALRGKTFAGNAVLDAPLEPIAEATRLGVPVLAVFTSDPGGGTEGRSMLSAERYLDVDLVAILPPAASVTLDDVALNPARGGGAAMLLDIMGRQIVAALQADLGVWATLWRRLIVKYEDVEIGAASFTVDDGVRVPARRMALACRTLPDPDFGSPLSGFWLALDTAMREDAALVPVADLIKGAIEGPAEMPDWHRIMAAMGWSLQALKVSGLGPVDPTAYADATDAAAGDEDGGTVDPAELLPAQPFGEAGALEVEP